MKRVTASTSVICEDGNAGYVATNLIEGRFSYADVTIEDVEPEPEEPWYIADVRQVRLRLAMREVRTSAQEAWLDAVMAICRAYDAAQREGK